MPYLEVAFNIPVHQTYVYTSAESVQAGCRVQTWLGNRKLSGWVVGDTQKAPEGVKLKPIDKVIDNQSLFGSDTLELAQWMSRLTLCSLGEALSCMMPQGRREISIELGLEGSDFEPVKNLTDGQIKSLDEIKKEPDGWFFLYGNTGSGKTEVFLRAAEHVLAQGKDVIYLVPEIALSHHLIDSISSRFSQNIAVLHSGLTPSGRLTQWRKIQRGECRLVLGARSAVFAPVKNLGLVIIDEEHEASYKSSATPRYHARQIAMRRCRKHQAALILGSATPSVEAWSAMQSGDLHRLNLTGRPAGGSFPSVEIVDMQGEKGLFSSAMLQALSAALASGRQALLFLNRRGFSYHFICQVCRVDVLCRHCSVPTTYHKNRNAMLCHYCGLQSPVPSSCPSCGSQHMQAIGFGTEKMEEEIRRLYPEKTVARLDSDSIRKKGILENTLRNFRMGKIDILLGTQIVAKGMNAPNLKLAVILSADSMMCFPDFRAAERTFALIVQVAGRVGRFKPDGQVFIQTYRPDALPVKLAALHNVEEFYRYELQQRRILDFPPYSRFFRIVVRGRQEERVTRCVQDMACLLTDNSPHWQLLGPVECPIGLIGGEYRHHLIVKTKSFDKAHQATRQALLGYAKPRGIRIEVDIDPLGML